MTSALQSTTPVVYAHRSQPAWGRAIVLATLPDRRTYVFEHAGARTFLNTSEMIVEVRLPPQESAALAASLLRQHAATPAPRSKRARATQKHAPEAATTPTFAEQLARLRALFPLGFEDPAYALRERGTAAGPDKKRDAGAKLARDLLSAAKLDAAIARGGFDDVLVSARRVLGALGSLSITKVDASAVSQLPAASHEPFARALRDLLHGEGAYAERFDAMVAAAKIDSWPVATVFSAVMQPNAHVFVKPKTSRRQAKVLGMADPPVGAPTGAGYAQHLAIALAVRDKLTAEGLRPRDLFDVYSFEWRTLTSAT